MSLFQGIIMSVLDIISYIIISKKLVNRKLKFKVILISTLLFSILIGLVSYYLSGWISSLCSGLILIVLTHYLYKQKIIDTVYLYLVSVILILAIQFITLIPLKFIFGEIVYNFNQGMVAQLINVSLIIIIANFIPIRYIYNFVIIKNKMFMYIIGNAFILMLFLLIYWNVNIYNITVNLISIVFLSLIIVFINFIILRNGLRNEQANNKLKAYDQYLPIIDELISDIKIRQHDFKNHIQALNMMIYVAKDKEEIINRFEKYMGEIAYKDELNDLLKFSNKVISGFLYSKKSQAETAGIMFSIIIQDSKFNSGLYDYELIEILGILIDNAIETKEENNEIIVIIGKEEDMNLLIVKNKYPYLEKEVIKNMFKKGISKKSGSKTNWGYGLYNLEKIVIKSKGTIEVYNETNINNYVVFKVLIP